MADEDKDQKTEEPTGKRLADARQKGQVVTSREVATAVLMFAAMALFWLQGSNLWLSLQEKMMFLLSGQIQGDLTQPGMIVLLRELLIAMLVDLAPFFGVFVVMAVLSALIQHGWLFTFEPIQPKLSKLNPIQGVKRLFSMRSVVEAIKSVFKIIIVGIAVYLGVKNNTEQIMGLADTTIAEMLSTLVSDSFAVMWRVTVAFILMAIFDFIYQKYEHIKGMRMTKQEVKDEMKQMEGDPLLKGRIRQIQRELAQSRMMQEVPKADVVITNPTHYAIALRYTPGEMSAPMLIAKGKGHIALRIREIAEENNIPRVENPPLARTLYRDVEVEQAIPPQLFKAVAEVLAYVYNLRGRSEQMAQRVLHRNAVHRETA
ncbi:flagellar biosynthesis protein FlhB [Magnetofaba australis]|uniref:Flagellar biosynthetic protein FlhB n=1 Tax=Magnetofaba australis IT-1 TaxID=1434232 RepID=A0A1Y2K729_9PROT|nr:flagellar biosynthesis protein FlhB [Magnetofaba australis]OSM06137.1 putative flagellar biosynthetic protein FlhB [Magnetofaba australis IT-1]